MELHVGTVLTGHFLKQGDQLLITLEAVQISTDKLIWQTNLTTKADDMIAMQAQLASELRRGLLPQLDAAGGFLETSTRPTNQQAYDLYLAKHGGAARCRS